LCGKIKHTEKTVSNNSKVFQPKNQVKIKKHTNNSAILLDYYIIHFTLKSSTIGNYYVIYKLDTYYQHNAGFSSIRHGYFAYFFPKKYCDFYDYVSFFYYRFHLHKGDFADFTEN